METNIKSGHRRYAARGLSPPASETPGPRLAEQGLRTVPSAAEILQALGPVPRDQTLRRFVFD